jgi:hypothetical protein
MSKQRRSDDGQQRKEDANGNNAPSIFIFIGISEGWRWEVHFLGLVWVVGKYSSAASWTFCFKYGNTFSKGLRNLVGNNISTAGMQERLRWRRGVCEKRLRRRLYSAKSLFNGFQMPFDLECVSFKTGEHLTEFAWGIEQVVPVFGALACYRDRNRWRYPGGGWLFSATRWSDWRHCALGGWR